MVTTPNSMSDLENNLKAYSKMYKIKLLFLLHVYEVLLYYLLHLYNSISITNVHSFTFITMERHKMVGRVSHIIIHLVHYCCCKSFSDDHATTRTLSRAQCSSVFTRSWNVHLRGVKTRRVRKTFAGRIVSISKYSRLKLE